MVISAQRSELGTGDAERVFFKSLAPFDLDQHARRLHADVRFTVIGSKNSLQKLFRRVDVAELDPLALSATARPATTAFRRRSFIFFQLVHSGVKWGD